MMKKYWKSLMAGAMCMVPLAIGSITAYAAEIQKTTDIVCSGYVDKYENELYSNHGESCNFVDEDGDDICDNHGENCHVTDEDRDGICDNAGLHAQKKCARNNKAKHSEKGNAAHSHNTAGHRQGNGHHEGRHRN